jgi:alcohol dehydrogenase (cytochrome c)
MNLPISRPLLAAGSYLFLALCSGAAVAQTATPVYTAAQAERGKTIYVQSCALCHGQNLDDGEFGPTLKGNRFRDGWVGKTGADLFDYTSRAMPSAAPNSLGSANYAAVLAYILQVNDIAAGAAEFPTEAVALQVVKMPWSLSPQGQLRAGGPSGGLSPNAVLPRWPTPPSAATKLTRVTDAMLVNPPAGSWLSWRRTLDDVGFSPLKEITKANVKSLQVAWSLTLPAGPNESTPLVHDGVMFVHSFGDHVQAIDAKTGDELWHYARRLPEGVPANVKRNISLYGDKVYFGTSDVHVVALDSKTGKVVWDTAIADVAERWSLSGGPLVAKGKVMQGIVGRGPGGAYLQALDAETGKEAWRFYSIARPDEFGGNSWNGLPLEQRNGGSIWTASSYDADLNLVYFGPAPTYDTGPLVTSIKKKGINSDALFSNATVAINPDTGKRVWHYQHVKNDQWDFDWAFERQILTLPVNGQMKKVVLTAGKEAFFDVVEAGTGKYVRSFDLGLQNIIKSVDPKTGEKTMDPNLYPGDGKMKLVCPHAGGAKSWLPNSYNPDTKLLYVPLVESCMDMIPVGAGERGSLSSGVRWALRPRPDSDGRYGRIQAVNVETGKTVWTERRRAPQSTGTLATAGGVVFAGALDRWFTAYDDATGATLWKARLNDTPSSAPITYTVDGKQYVAMVVGHGGAQAATFPSLVPEIPLPAVRSSSVWVFELPQ